MEIFCQLFERYMTNSFENITTMHLQHFSEQKLQKTALLSNFSDNIIILLHIWWRHKQAKAIIHLCWSQSPHEIWNHQQIIKFFEALCKKFRWTFKADCAVHLSHNISVPSCFSPQQMSCLWNASNSIEFSLFQGKQWLQGTERLLKVHNFSLNGAAPTLLNLIEC